MQVSIDLQCVVTNLYSIARVNRGLTLFHEADILQTQQLFSPSMISCVSYDAIFHWTIKHFFGFCCQRNGQ